MSIHSRQTAWRLVLFGLLGLLMEVFFGAACSLASGRAGLRGSTSIWMAPLYALPAIALMPASRRLAHWRLPLPLRAVVYMVAIYAVEFASGAAFHAFGLRVWDYRAMPYNAYGYVTLAYAPLWYALGLALESVYRRVATAAQALANSPGATKAGDPGFYVSRIPRE